MDRKEKIKYEIEELGNYLKMLITLDRNYNWFIIPRFDLPGGFLQPDTIMLLKLIQYPDIPPGIYPNNVYFFLDLQYKAPYSANYEPLRNYHFEASDLSHKDWHMFDIQQIHWKKEFELLTFYHLLLAELVKPYAVNFNHTTDFYDVIDNIDMEAINRTIPSVHEYLDEITRAHREGKLIWTE
ncbi:MAG: hypothetical protein AB1571_02615 [Nanoarchaeota archaeon]